MRRRASYITTVFAAIIKCAIMFGLMLAPSLLFAQTETPVRGKVEVDKDPKVDSLIGNYLLGGSNKPNVSGGNGVGVGTGSSEGYRVQIFSGSDRKQAFNTQSKFQDTHPGVRTYVSYLAPNFKVHVGDFRSRLEAEKVADNLRRSYTGLFIISEKINLPKLDSQ